MSAVPRKSLGRFEIVRVLGKGAMGIVYEGLDPRLNRRVAIKTILRSAIMDEEAAKDYAARFVREAQAVARLTHPNIVGVYDFGDEDDITFIVMEFIDGKELKSFLDAGHRFDFPSTVRIMNELLDGLGYAHRQGVVHRDIKPANIMIDTAGRVKLTDFGVARITESAERTQVGTMVGTPSYMSPEQIQGASSDNRTDIFACGVILYQMLTGEKPFTGAGTWTIYNQILLQDPTPPTALNSSLPPAIDRVVSKALAKAKEDRYRNAAEMASALTTLLLGTADGDGEGDADEDATRFLLPSDAVRMAEAATQRRAEAGIATRPQPGASTVPPAVAGAQEVELEFWRSIKDSVDPADHELYLQKFPSGIYAELARRKARRLRDPAAADATDPTLRNAGPALVDPDATAVAGSMPASAATRPPPVDAAEATLPRAPVAAASGPSLGLIGGGAAGLAAIAVGAWLMLGRGDPAPVATPPVAAPVGKAVPAPPGAAPVGPAAAPQTPAATVTPAPAATTGNAQVQPKEDPDAQRRIDSAIERAKADSEEAAARKRAAVERAAAEKAAARAAAERAAAEKAAERAAADRAAAERASAERASAERAAAERAAADRAAAERVAAERAAAERAAADKAAATAKAAAERAAAEKAAADRAAAERAAAAKAASIERALADERAAAASRAAEPAKRAGGRQN